MQRRTTTRQINTAITNNLLQVVKAECRYKSSDRIDEIGSDTFIENLQFVCESGVFADFADWHYERNLSEKDGYIFSSGSMNPYTENMITVYMRIANGACSENIEKELLFLED